MDPRGQTELTPVARIAGRARSLVMRMARCSLCRRDLPPNNPDYADFRTELAPFMDIEILKARLEEAKLAKNEPRIAELRGQLGAAYLAVTDAIIARKATANK
jgi:hypothetical protein